MRVCLDSIQDLYPVTSLWSMFYNLIIISFCKFTFFLYIIVLIFVVLKVLHVISIIRKVRIIANIIKIKSKGK